jgi:branched-chain amino acid transport system substrate-binding protein
MRIRLVLAVCLALAVLVPATLAGRAADPGLTATSILLGGTAPISGSASAYASVARGADAYFKYVNAGGGVNGRTITYTYRDDAYTAAQTVEATRQLVERDGVFALFNSVGTAPNLAIRPYLTQLKVPQLFVASGDTRWGRDFRRFPYTIGFQPSYRAEGWVLGRYLARMRPRARLAILAQNDDDARDLVAGIKRGTQRSPVKIVAAEYYDVAVSDVQAQVAELSASGADTFAIFATPEFALQSFAAAKKLGWRPLVLVGSASSAANVMRRASAGGTNKAINGAVSISFLKDPSDRRWKNDRAIRLYRSILSRYGRGANAGDVYHVYGMAAAYTMVEVVKQAGPSLTRAALMRHVRSLTIASNPFLLPGITIRTAGDDQFPIEQMVLQRWQQGRWKSFGGLWSYRPE